MNIMEKEDWVKRCKFCIYKQLEEELNYYGVDNGWSWTTRNQLPLCKEENRILDGILILNLRKLTELCMIKKETGRNGRIFYKKSQK